MLMCFIVFLSQPFILVIKILIWFWLEKILKGNIVDLNMNRWMELLRVWRFFLILGGLEGFKVLLGSFLIFSGLFGKLLDSRASNFFLWNSLTHLLFLPLYFAKFNGGFWIIQPCGNPMGLDLSYLRVWGHYGIKCHLF